MGQFGAEWEACDRMSERLRWDRKLGLGRERRSHEVRRLHCDATFLDEYLTQDFCERQGLFISKKNPRTGRKRSSLSSFEDVKQALLFHFTNGGRPVIEVLDANHAQSRRAARSFTATPVSISAPTGPRESSRTSRASGSAPCASRRRSARSPCASATTATSRSRRISTRPR